MSHRLPEDLREVTLLMGTRPEAIKLMPVLRALERAGLEPRVVLTGQHRELVEPILAELGIRVAEDLSVMESDQPLAALSARVLERCRSSFEQRRPQLLVVQGDTTSAAMGALAAFYEGIPVAHVEAGLRTFDPARPFPEEMNRRLIACLAQVHFAPTPRAAQNLRREGVPDGRIHVVGNTVIDALLHARDELLPRWRPDPRLVTLLDTERDVVLVTGHRRESLGPDLEATCEGIGRLAEALPDRVEILFPVHKNPAVEGQVRRTLDGVPNVRLLPPLSYLAFVSVMLRAKLIITDSGGVQEEAAFLGIPLLVTRRSTERHEGVEAGVAELTPGDADRLFERAYRLLADEEAHRARAVATRVFGDGTAGERIVETLLRRSPNPSVPASDGAPRRRGRKTYVVLPAFNEEASIGALLDHIDESMFEASQAYEVIVVDDGSDDATADIVRERSRTLPVALVQHTRNLGLGATIRSGLGVAAARVSDRDVVVTMDADATHTPALIRRMVRMIGEGHDVIVASRYQPGSRTIGVPWSRRFLSYSASLLFRILLPTPGVRDFTCGYRAYRGEMLRAAMSRYGDEFLREGGFECMVDILLKLRRMQPIFGEVPFILRYDLKEGHSKMNVARTVAATLSLIAREMRAQLFRAREALP